jgi:hypothetical protein
MNFDYLRSTGVQALSEVSGGVVDTWSGMYFTFQQYGHKSKIFLHRGIFIEDLIAGATSITGSPHIKKCHSILYRTIENITVSLER